jgi:antitoxin component YwqK of YwqJK toxin-antitoxin module
MSFFGVAQSFEIYNGDTINRQDYYNCKEGKWRVTGKLKPSTCYLKDQIAEEGNYIGNRKTGLWIEYFCNGNMRTKINFVDGRPNGHAIMFHENGKKNEEGDWNNGRYFDNYKVFDSTGTRFWEIDIKPWGRYQTLVNNNGRTFMQGIFKDKSSTELLTGVEYIYDEKNRIAKIKNFQDGVYVGDLPLKK